MIKTMRNVSSEFDIKSKCRMASGRCREPVAERQVAPRTADTRFCPEF